MPATPEPAPAPADHPHRGSAWANALVAGCILLASGIVGLLGVATYFVVMDPRYFLEKIWIAFFGGGTVVVALGGFLVARSFRMRRAQARHS